MVLYHNLSQRWDYTRSSFNSKRDVEWSSFNSKREAVSTQKGLNALWPALLSPQKGTLNNTYSNCKCNGNIIHINVNDYEGTYNVGDVLNCITEKGEVIYTIIEKYDNSDIFINGKIVNDFNILDKNYIYTLNVSATQELHRIIMEHKNETNDLKTWSKSNKVK